jgi:predicted nucleic acid-binding protein
MRRTVFDTVVFVRALINPFGVWGRLIFEHGDAYTLIVSPPVVEEILDVLHRPELTGRFRSLAGLDVARVIAILDHAEAVELRDIPAVSRDPKDRQAPRDGGSRTGRLPGDRGR